MTARSLDSILRPRSVAVIGASADKTRIGGRPLRYLLEGGFAGEIYPVNPGRDDVQGLRAYKSIELIPAPVDCAIIALPAEAVLAAIRACAKKGVGAAVVFSAGFAEMGTDGQALQDRISEVARAAGMRVIGPNCLGVFNVHCNAYLTFSGVFEDVVGSHGRLGLVSQSGGYAGEVVKQAKPRGLSFGIWMTTGNEVDVELGEAMLYMAESPDVDVVVGYIEGVRNSHSFLAALETAHRKRKPVIVLKVGRTEQGAEAAASHTASLAGSDSVYDTVLKRYGAYRARTTEEMLDVAYAASRGVFPNGRRIAILTNSGGIGVQAADFASDENLEVPTTRADVQAALRAISPNAATRNPIDLTGQVANDPPMYARGLDAVLGAGGFDLAYLCVGLIAGLPFITKSLLESLADAAARYPATPLAATVTAPPDIVRAYEKAGFLCYDEPARALHSLAALAYFAQVWGSDPGSTQLPDLTAMPSIASGKSYSETESKSIIAAAGVPCPAEFIVQNGAEALTAAKSLGRAVAIKVVSRDIPHKTEVGGVALRVEPADAGRSVEAMERSVRAAKPGAHIDGYLITPMLDGGIECIIGVTVDPVFGPVMLFGLGGVTVEVFNDVTSERCPVNPERAAAMIKRIKGFPLLNGFRGRPKGDLAALAQAICRISQLALANAAVLRTLEVNPLLVFAEGRGVLAIDAVIEA